MWITYDAISDYWTGEGYLVIEEEGETAIDSFPDYDSALDYIEEERGGSAADTARFIGLR
jgi:hypothetical protein